MADSRILIKTIQIKNFRSIRAAKIDCRNMNIFVGQNDVGKSNVLKALNLFFNGKTDYETEFDFKHDFSYYFPKSGHNTREIVISIDFLIPDTYKEHGIITWKKIWRVNNYFDEKISLPDGKEPSPRTRVISSLRRMKYRYVPAVKSKEYYKSLLTDLYMTVSSVLDSPLEKSVNEFSTVIKNYTEQISREVTDRIGLNSVLSMPENMSELFRTLIFKTTNTDTNSVTIPLDFRGDGIQARHIPIILKYIADEDQKTRNQGSVKVSTIWGFEEPENGVELLKAFDMADDFLGYADEIQLFVTTHSPAFYLIDNKDIAKVVYASCGENITEGTKLSDNYVGNEIGRSMGLMPIIAPYVREQEKIVSNLRNIVNTEMLSDIPTIFVEGVTDKTYLQIAIKLFSEKMWEDLENGKLRIYSKDGEDGCRSLVNRGLAWIYSGNKNKAYLLFDQDDAGKKSRNELIQNDIYKKGNGGRVKAELIVPSEMIRSIFDKKLNFTFEIEHLLSVEFWKVLKKRNYLVQREFDEVCR